MSKSITQPTEFILKSRFFAYDSKNLNKNNLYGLNKYSVKVGHLITLSLL